MGGHSSFFNRKAVVGETKFRSAPNVCESILGNDASQLYLYATRQPTSTGLYTHRAFDVQLQRIKPRSNKVSSFEHVVMAFFQRLCPDCKLENFHKTLTLKNLIVSLSTDFVVTLTQFWAVSYFYHFVSVRTYNLFSPMKKLSKDIKKTRKWTI